MKKIVLMLLLSLLVLMVSTGLAAGVVRAERTVVDMAGRSVSLPDRVERVVTTYHTASQFVFALGAQERIAAAETKFDSLVLFQKLLPGIEEIPQIGSKRKGVNLEGVIAANPDLVILYPFNDGPEVADKLQELGIASVIINPESFQEIRETNLLLGKALNLEEKAAEIDQKYAEILELAEKTRELPEAARKVVYFANSELLDTVGSGMMQTSLIELAGGINPAARSKTGFIKTSPEELYQWDPDFIITSQRYQGEITGLYDDPRYQSIKAVRDERIYRAPSNLEPWDFPSPSSYLLITWLGKKLYPEQYSEVNLEEFVNEFYRVLYGKSYQELGGKLN